MTNNELTAWIRQMERTVKRSMKKLPPGEHLHVASIIAEQNSEIVGLKKKLRKRRTE